MFSTNLNKPAFGATAGNTSFGFGSPPNTNQNPFGQSQLFGKPATAAFGAQQTPAFGQPAQGSLFPSSQAPNNSLFPTANTSAFGTAPSAQPAFGSNIFGQQQQQQPAAGSGIFGSTSTFGQQNKPAGFGFGSTPQPQQQSNIFGQQPAQQNTSLFQPGPSNIFGSPGNAFVASNVPTGTSIKFTPVTGNDTMQKNGVAQSISTKHHCITCMKEYEGKSLEELRWEDYQLNRKGPTQQAGFGTAPFGQAAGAPTMFGQTDNKPAFGQAGFGQTTSTFGQSTPGFGLSNQPSNTNIFGKPTGFGTPSSNASTFGFNSSPSAAPNPFGAANQQKPFGSTPTQPLFGTPTQQPQQNTAGFGTGLFGQNNQNTGGNLFSKPAQPTTGFNTGQTTFGFNQTPATQSAPTLFQQPKPATSSFGFFGTQPPTSGTFGQTNTFGQTTQPSFATNFAKPLTFGQTSQPSFGLMAQPTNSLFNNNQQKPGLFGSTSTGLFSNNFQTSFSTFGQQTQLSTQQPAQGQFASDQSQEAKNLALISSDPFGHSPHLAGLVPVSSHGTSVSYATNPHELKKLLDSSKKVDDVPGNSRNKLKLCPPKVHRDNMFDEVADEEANRYYKSSCKRLLIKNNQDEGSTSIFDNQPTYTDLITDSRNDNRRSTHGNKSQLDSVTLAKDSHEPTNGDKNKVSHLTQSRKLYPDLEDGVEHLSFSSNKESQTPKKPEKIMESSEIMNPDRNYLLRDSVTDLLSSQSSSGEIVGKIGPSGDVLIKSVDTPSSQPELTPLTKNGNSNEEPAKVNTNDDTKSDNPCGVILTRPEYYTLPTLKELPKYINEDGRCLIQGFTVGRKGYGNVYFPDELDVRNLNLDEIVHFRNKEIHMYPDEAQKPPVGEGLNRRAQVTLDNVFPRVKETKEIIKDVYEILTAKFPEQLKDISSKHNMKFLDYRPETGSWVFMVDHFSKYAFTESDEECCEVSTTKGKEIVVLKAPFEKKTFTEEATDKMGLGGSLFQRIEDALDSSEDDILHQSMAVDLHDEDEEELVDLYPRSAYSGSDVQVMKLTFFDPPEGSLSVISSPISLLQQTEPLIKERVHPKPIINRPLVSTVYINTEVKPDEENIIGLRCISDAGIFRGRGFKVGWTKGLSFFMPQNKKTLEVEKLNGLWQLKYEPPAKEDVFQQNLVEMLKIAHECSDYGEEADIPTLKLSRADSFLRQQMEVFQRLIKIDKGSYMGYLSDIWNLCFALWGSGYKKEQFVKERLSKWLQAVVHHHMATLDVNHIGTDLKANLNTIFKLLSCFNLEEAASLALKINMPNLAMSITLANPSVAVRRILQEQIAMWKEMTISDHIKNEVMKFYLLLSGTPFMEGLNVLEGLDWKRCFGAHLWFLVAERAPISEVIRAYTEGFTGRNYAVKPLPPYAVGSGQSTSYDIIYQIILLYKNQLYRLNKVLNPNSHTCDPVDYRLSWLLYLFFKSKKIGLIQDSEEREINIAFSAQLEHSGLWNWAVLPLLYLKDNDLKRTLILGILQRNVQPESSEHDLPMEKMLVNELGLPTAWIHMVKANKNILLRRPWSAFAHFTYARDWVNANKLFVDHVFPHLFSNVHDEQLEMILSNMKLHKVSRISWITELELIQSFLNIEKHVDSTDQENDLILMHKELCKISSRLRLLPTLGVLHCVCVAEFTKRVILLFKAISDKIESRHLLPPVEELIDRNLMPPDYVNSLCNVLCKHVSKK